MSPQFLVWYFDKSYIPAEDIIPAEVIAEMCR